MSRDTIRLPHDAYWLLQTLRAAGAQVMFF